MVGEQAMRSLAAFLLLALSLLRATDAIAQAETFPIDDGYSPTIDDLQAGCTLENEPVPFALGGGTTRIRVCCATPSCERFEVECDDYPAWGDQACPEEGEVATGSMGNGNSSISRWGSVGAIFTWAPPPGGIVIVGPLRPH